MVTKEDLQHKYRQFTTERLLEIIDNPANYTELAVDVAIAEFKSRNVSEEEMTAYHTKQINNKVWAFKTYIERNINIELNFFQKLFFFFFFLPPLNLSIKLGYRKEEFRLKLRQSNYYSLIGFVSLMLVVVVVVNFNLDISDATTLGIWMIFFIPAYLLDGFFNRKARVKKTKKILWENGFELEDVE
ncbi:hypothetical protein [Mucilaginibacter kameinonensis]|uniref:hypothetical protein n=1 Tax=Mucilaginibacter kameinonensis TaxID=452286 RepID=UPI000EF7F24B|nr:hypothetical protein [Mucilaginibacter kameinonensis]